MEVDTVTPIELHGELEQWSVLDVREPREVAGISIEGATAIPLGDLSQRITELPQARPIAVLCETGIRSAQAIPTLKKFGFSNLFNVSGGIKAWQAAGLPVILGGPLDAPQLDRYARHVALPSVGAAGQLALLQGLCTRSRSRRPWIPRCAVPRRRGYWPSGFVRLRCCGAIQPPTPDPALNRHSGYFKSGVGNGAAQGAKLRDRDSRHRYRSIQSKR